MTLCPNCRNNIAKPSMDIIRDFDKRGNPAEVVMFTCPVCETLLSVQIVGPYLGLRDRAEKD